jgi:regulator of replication initiation timing
MENQKSNSGLKAVVLILSLALGGSLFYIFKMTNDANLLASEVKSVKTEKENIIIELGELKTKYESAINENTAMSDELIVEREKVVDLMAKIQNAKGDDRLIAKYKGELETLKTKMTSLLQEVETLKAQNQLLTTNLDSTKVALEGERVQKNELVVKNDDLVKVNDDLSKTVEKGSKLSILNLKTAAYKQRKSGKEIVTGKARRADVLKVSFTIAENSIAKSGDKNYYVQVIDSNNNVLGEKATESFGEKSLTYSFISTVKFDNKTIDVTEDLKGEDFAKGTYFVNVFDKNELVSNSTFELK